MYFIKNKFDLVLGFLRLLTSNYRYFISSWNQTDTVKWQWIPLFKIVLSVPILQHWDNTVFSPTTRPQLKMNFLWVLCN